MPVLHYSFRRSALEQERTYSLEDGQIVVQGGGAPARIYPLRDVRRVHLKYEHTKQREYYQCRIDTVRGRIDLRHVHYAGFATFEDRRGTYTPFVKGVLAALADVPGVRFQAGSLANFIGAIVGLPLMVALSWICLSFGKIALAVFAAMMAGLALLMIVPSKPGRFDPLAPPDNLLPQ